MLHVLLRAAELNILLQVKLYLVCWAPETHIEAIHSDKLCILVWVGS